MVASMEWEKTERGYRLNYNGHELEITRRRPDSIERRTFVVSVDGREDPVPLWNLPSAKTRAIRAVTLNGGKPIGRLSLKKQQELTQQMEPFVEVLDRMPEAEPEVLPEVQPEPQAAAVESPAPGPSRRVSYTITGSFEVDKLGAGYNTLETAMEALRELGDAGCTVKSPEDIEL
jgi:hypothetical protein